MQKILIFLIFSFYAIQTNDNVVSITLIEYAQIINEIDSISSNIYNYCIKINYLQSEELKGKCIGYIMQSIHTNMPKSFKTLNILLSTSLSGPRKIDPKRAPSLNSFPASSNDVSVRSKGRQEMTVLVSIFTRLSIFMHSLI